MDVPTYAILGVATGAKVLLLGYCWALRGQSDSMMALAEDHSNDIISNLGARPASSPGCAHGPPAAGLLGARLPLPYLLHAGALDAYSVNTGADLVSLQM